MVDSLLVARHFDNVLHTHTGPRKHKSFDARWRVDDATLRTRQYRKNLNGPQAKVESVKFKSISIHYCLLYCVTEVPDLIPMVHSH